MFVVVVVVVVVWWCGGGDAVMRCCGGGGWSGAGVDLDTCDAQGHRGAGGSPVPFVVPDEREHQSADSPICASIWALARQ
jgi:hypothetical protein